MIFEIIMSKNIFSVLKHDDSDDEKKPVQPQAPRPTKKERRETDQKLRDTYGDSSNKEAHKPSHNPPRNKGDYASGQKRPFERHSGTGRPAFTNDFKKGGHGKGNAGHNEKAPQEQNEENQNNEEQPKVEEKKPEIEEIITPDEYIAKSGLQFNFLANEEPIKNTKPVVINDPNVKLVQQKVKDEPAFNSKKAKNPDSLIQGSKNIIDDQSSAQRNNFGKRKNSPQQKKRIEYNEENFPALG